MSCRNDVEKKVMAGVPLLATILVVVLAFPLVSALAQRVSQPSSEGNLLPAGTGEAVTVKPTDLPDIQCSVVDWNKAPPKPALTLLCPPEEVFAPLRVYIKLSWLKPKDVPDNASHILAPPKTQTKLRTSKKAASVWLKVSGNAEEQPQAKWVSFNSLVDVALLTQNVRIVARRAPHP